MHALGKRRVIAVAISAALALAAAQVSFGQEDDDDEEEEEELEFEEADLFLELNDTDGDLGLQGFVEGDAWKSLEIEGPDRVGEPLLMNIWLRNGLRRQGLSEFFFESDEPGFDELSPAAFLRRFPQGIYDIEAITLEDEEMESEVFLSHTLAGPPSNITINGQDNAENCDAPELPVVTEPVTLDWDPVTQSHPTIGNTGVAVNVHHYEVVGEIEREDRSPEELVFSAILPRGRTKFEFPVDFTSLAEEEMKWELIIVLGNGNKTAVESCFEIER